MFASTLIDGIYYEFAGTEATVVSGANKYTGDIIIPESVTYNENTYSVTNIGYSAFMDCTGLTNITIPLSVTSIDIYAFYGCSGLTNITFPSSVTNIGSCAFHSCRGLTSITIPTSVTSIGDRAFCDCQSLSSITVDAGNTVYDSRENCNAIIETSSNTLVEGCKNTIIPSSVTSIGSGAFYLSGLTSITIPEGVTSIGNGAFTSTRLTSITIPEGVTSIGNDAFQSCTSLKSITIPVSLTNIGDCAFYGCSGLTSISIPANLMSIGRSAFYACRGLTSITIPSSVTSIGVGAFSYCPGLSSIIVDAGNTVYDSRENCNAIIETSSNTLVAGCKNTIIPSSVTKIGNSAFYLCSDLTSITIPSSVTSIGDYALGYCSGLSSIIVDAGNTVYDSRENCNAIIETSSNTLVAGCKNTIIPSSVTSIGSCAFYLCTSLTSITIPEGVTTIGADAFFRCSGLKTIYSYIESPTSDTGSNFDSSNYTNATLNVPYGTKSLYQSTDGWKNFTNIVEMAGLPTEVESAFIDVEVLGIDDQELHEISAGTTLCESSSVSMSNAYDDSFSAVSMAISDVQNYQVNINGKKYIYGEGVRGAANAKPYSIGECQEDGTFVGGQYEGWVYKFTTLYDGYLYVPCRIATNKSIYVWAGNADEAAGRLVAYNYRGITSDGQLASVSLPSNSDDYYVGPNEEYDLYDRLQTIQSIDKNLIVEESSLWTNGVIAFPVKASVGTYYVCATGTKLHSNGFVFVPGAKDIGEVVFSPRTFTLTYQVDGETYRTYELAEGDVITPEAAPTKEGYTFSGWSEIPETMPANDVTVTGTFTAIPEPSSDNALAISNAETYAGKQVVLPIDMNNVASIKAFQFDLYLPDGITIAKDEDDEELIELTTRAAKSHTIAYSNRPDGAIRMICTSMSGATFKGNEGAIVNVTLDVAQSMTDGDYDIEIKNIELSDGTPYNPADIKATLTVKTYTPGDVDGTGTVSVNDAVCVINYILGSPAEDFIEPAADLDGNGVITVNDVVILINDYILGGNSQNSLDLAFLEDVTADDDYLYIEEDNLSNMTAGEEREIEVFMNTSRTDIQGLQCDIYLPDGMEFVPEEDGDEKYYADKGGRAAKSHSVASQLMADGSVRVVETSTSGAKFKANELAVFYFTVRATANTAYGQGIRLCNMELSYGGEPINPEDRTFDVNVKAGTVSLNSNGYATFSYASDVAIEGAEVYTATKNGNIIACTKEEQSIAAYNGVILKGEPNATVTIYTNAGIEDYTSNELKATTTADGLADIETALVLSGNMFKNYTGAAFEANKAYMPYDGNSGNAMVMVFDDATSVGSIGAESNLLDGAVIKTFEDGKLVIKTSNGKYTSVGAKMK